MSEFGVLYRLGVVAGTAGLQVEEVCNRSFAGGSASTPTLSRDGRRVYLGDNFGKLLAIEDDCGVAWEIDLGAQIFGPVAVASDGNEVYASTRAGVKKVRDLGPTPALEWAATIDPYENLDPMLVPVQPDDPAATANRQAWAALRRFDRPFLCAFSDGDPIMRGRDEVFLAEVPGTKGVLHRVITGAGHFLQEDRPEELALAVLDFVRA